jgi:hypothetical protein
VSPSCRNGNRKNRTPFAPGRQEGGQGGPALLHVRDVDRGVGPRVVGVAEGVVAQLVAVLQPQVQQPLARGVSHVAPGHQADRTDPVLPEHGQEVAGHSLPGRVVGVQPAAHGQVVHRDQDLVRPLDGGELLGSRGAGEAYGHHGRGAADDGSARPGADQQTLLKARRLSRRRWVILRGAAGGVPWEKRRAYSMVSAPRRGRQSRRAVEGAIRDAR